MQKEIMTQGQLLDESGNLRQKGWGRSNLLEYHRDQIKAAPFLIKEWDYYAVLNDEFGIALTIADNGYLGIAVVTVFDFTVPKQWTKQIMVPFPLGKFKMPQSSSHGDIRFEKDGFKLAFLKTGATRSLEVTIKDFSEGKTLNGTIDLKETQQDSLMIATPFHKSKRFYYNQKINSLQAKGRIIFGSKQLDFGTKKSYGVLDWGRGVWTYSNTWCWGSASSEIEGHVFGFNIGYGFGDTTAATENIVFYDGIGHKLDHVTFNIPDDDYLKPWIFTSNDQRFELTFEPVIDRSSNTKVLILQSDQHQVFGYFSGKVVLDDGKVIVVNQVFGFAEKVMNRW